MLYFICTANTGYAGQQKQWLHKSMSEANALAEFEDTAVEYIESWDSMNGISNQEIEDEYEEDENFDEEFIPEGFEREYNYYVKEIDETQYSTMLANGELEELDYIDDEE